MRTFKKLLCAIISLVLLESSALAYVNEVTKVNTVYRSENGFGISEKEKAKTTSFAFKDTIGSLYISSQEVTPVSEEEYNTYIIKSGYSAQFSLQSIQDLTKSIETWRWGLDSEGTSKIGEYDWKKSIGKGGIIVQKSYDRENWETVYTKTDVFKTYSKNITSFYSASRKDLDRGCYYKVIIAYRKAKKTRDSSFIGFDTSKYIRAYCVEVYDLFLVSSEESEFVNVSVSSPEESNLDKKAAQYGSGAVAGQSISNQVAGQEILATAPGKTGFAGEAANIQNEAINSLGTGNSVQHKGADNAKNGPDYIIASPNGEIIQIQTKYGILWLR